MASEFALLQSDNGGIYGNYADLVISNNDIKLITGQEMLQQQIVKCILTVRGSLPLFPNYGTLLTTMMGGRINASLLQDLKNEILWGLKYVKQMDINETININTIEDVSLNFNSSEPRELDLKIALLLTNGTYLTIQTTARKPGQ